MFFKSPNRRISVHDVLFSSAFDFIDDDDDDELMIESGEDDVFFTVSSRNNIDFLVAEDLSAMTNRVRVIAVPTVPSRSPIGNKSKGYTERPKSASPCTSTVYFELKEEPPVDFVINGEDISEYERRCLPEFFRTKGVRAGAKTPARYLAIKKRILLLWKDFSIHGKYLNKLTCRKVLLGEVGGDANSFSRVHAFLEQIGAINSGLVNKRKSSMQPGERKRSVSTGPVSHQACHEDSFDRYARNFETESDLEGPQPRHPTFNSIIQFFEQDPFLQIPLSGYPDGVSPFFVVIKASVFEQMITDSRGQSAEPIGLLGGSFCDTVLEIKVMIPCSVMCSTDKECDIDPVAEMKAWEYLAALGMRLVGWFHTHPDYDPLPSIRDIETQSTYQSMVSEAGIEPFVGFIAGKNKELECIHISNTMNISGAYRNPFRIPFEINE